MARLLYSCVLYVLTPFICIRLWWRGHRVAGYRRRWRERFGFIAAIADNRKVIWVHAVSVGETIAAVPLIRKLQAAHPDYLVAVTTTTPTGSDRVRAMLGESVYHSYAPYDLPDAVARTLDRLHPRCLIIMETELWPNLIAGCHQRDIPVIVANARLSARSATGYGRFGMLTGPMLRQLTVVAAQHADDGDRFLRLGLPAENLQITGNIKFDLTFSAEQRQLAQQLGQQWRGDAGRPVWLAASTHGGEEDIILDAFERVRRSHPAALLVLVPRHPDRFEAVAAHCRQRGFTVLKHSTGQSPHRETDILLGDTMGELSVFYGACDLAFVGGSLVPVGGHNLLEPAAWKKPVLSGPQLFNFAEISALLLAAGGLEICASAEQIAQAVCALLADDRQRLERGLAASAVVENNRGAMARLLEIIALRV